MSLATMSNFIDKEGLTAGRQFAQYALARPSYLDTFRSAHLSLRVTLKQYCFSHLAVMGLSLEEDRLV
jgi:hypothetical protein